MRLHLRLIAPRLFDIVSNMKRLLLLIAFLTSSYLAAEEIVVHLNAHEKLAPFYIKPFATDYGKKLQEILRFDLASNGFMQERKKQNHVEYVLHGTVAQQELGVTVEIVNEGRLIAFEKVSICGQLESDRAKVHQIADAICKRLFNHEGICSKKILYSVRTKKSADASMWTSEIWQADSDGAGAKQVTHQNALCVTPCYLPIRIKGETPYFLYVSYRSGEPKIYIGSTKEPLAKRLTYLSGNQFMPAITAACNRVAFISDVSGSVDLFMQDFSIKDGVLGKAKKIFSAPMATQGTPSFNHDGTKVAFVSNKDGTARIYTLNLETKRLRLISKQNRDNTSPCWSSDGKQIAYSAQTLGTRQIWIYNLKTDQEEQITFGAGHKENPVWAANNLHLLYNTESKGACELYLTNTRQKNNGVKLSKGPKDKRFAAWEP